MTNNIARNNAPNETAESTPSLCVVICVHNAPDYTGICIDSVLRHTDAPYELILVNDGSQMPTTRLLQRYADEYDHIRLIHHHKAKGYTGAANAGLRASAADYTVLLNSDTIVSPHWAKRLIACGQSDAAIGIIGPLSNAATYQSVPFVFDDAGRWKQNTLPEGVTVSHYAQAIAQVSTQSYPRTPVANGFCFTVKRSLIDAIGYLDEETFPRGYGEENDYCLRAADAGFAIAIADDAYVYHATSKSFGVSQREKLTRDAHHAIRSKHSQERLDAIDSELRGHSGLEAVRERIVKHVYHAQALHPERKDLPPLQAGASERAILFLIPGCSPQAGGTQVIVETARGLDALGVRVRVAAKDDQREAIESFFPADAHLFRYYKRERELVAWAGGFDIAIATIFHSIRQLQAITRAHAHITPAYYVQDYEPYFLDGYPGLKQLAEESYTMIPGCTLFGISPWVVDIVREKHGAAVEKITGCLDQSLFFPSYTPKPPTPLVIGCMIRPSTSWRGPKRSMRVLKELKEQHGKTIEIRTFGCPLEQIGGYGLETEFDFHHYGILGRHDVAALLRRCDVFVDLSDFQAFGRTALEAMACGCAVVAPREGGVHDFGRDGENLLLADTSSEAECVLTCNDLISDPTKRARLGRAGIETGLTYSIHRSTLSFLELMERITARQKQRSGQRAA